MGGNQRQPERSAAEELILRTVAAHADSLLRTARRHSICIDDAHDAYQRGLEIFMRHAYRLDPGRAGAWLHTVVKHEAQALRRSRQELVGSEEFDVDRQEARRLPTPEEQLLSFDMVSRSAEALQRLKPQELRALWLKAQGHSYNDIGAITGWSYTKVNRCIAEGRQSFLERYAGIESGEECERWMPILSAIMDGEATQTQILELRPHLRNCPGCRGRLKAMRDSSEPLAAVLPVPFVAAVISSGEPLSDVVLRLYETVAGALHDRAAYSVAKAQAVFDAAAAGKVTAVAASAAAVAGGGYVSVERSVRAAPETAPAKKVSHARSSPSRPPMSATPLAPSSSPKAASDRQAEKTRPTQGTVFGAKTRTRRGSQAPEFAEPIGGPSKSRQASRTSAEFSRQSTGAPEFGSATPNAGRVP